MVSLVVFFDSMSRHQRLNLAAGKERKEKAEKEKNSTPCEEEEELLEEGGIHFLPLPKA